MNKVPKRAKDAIRIPEGVYFEVYVPKSGTLISPSSNKRIKYAKFYLSADANVSFKDVNGRSVNGFPLSKGRHDFLVTEISSVSAGTVAIVHDGELHSGYEQ